jgi:hypothetical protein
LGAASIVRARPLTVISTFIAVSLEKISGFDGELS